MAYTYEAHESPTFNDDGSIDRVFIVNTCRDALQAEGLAYTIASPSFEGRNRAPNMATRPLGYDTYECRVKYTLPSGGGNDQNDPPVTQDPPQGVIEFDTGGASQHITTALAQTHYPQNAPDMKRAIGVGRDSVEGVDIIVPKLTFTITRHFAINAITGTYVKNLARLTGKTNQLDYELDGEQFEAGELLFMGASGTCRGRTDWEIAFSFEASENATDLSVSPTLTNIAKEGHQYMWVRFKHEENSNNLVQVPEFAYVATVYKKADFKAVLGF